MKRQSSKSNRYRLVRQNPAARPSSRTVTQNKQSGVISHLSPSGSARLPIALDDATARNGPFTNDPPPRNDPNGRKAESAAFLRPLRCHAD